MVRWVDVAAIHKGDRFESLKTDNCCRAVVEQTKLSLGQKLGQLIWTDVESNMSINLEEKLAKKWFCFEGF